MDKKQAFIAVFLLGEGAIVGSFFISPFPVERIVIVAFQAIAFAIIMYGVYRLLEFIPKIVLFFTTPQPSHLHLFPDLFLNHDELALNFIYTEWRYLFNVSEVYISVPSFAKPQSREFLVWRKNPTQIWIKSWRFLKLDFIQVDSKKNEFWIKVENNDQFRYKSGVYAFDVFVAANIITKNGHIPYSRGFAAIIIYKGSRQISVKIVERKYAKEKLNQEQEKYKKDNL